jgi:hypothetical protein
LLSAATGSPPGLFLLTFRGTGAAMAEASGFSIDAYTSFVIERFPVVTENCKKFGGLMNNRNHDGNQTPLKVWAEGYTKSLELCRALDVDDTLPTALMQNFDKAIRGIGNLRGTVTAKRIYVLVNSSARIEDISLTLQALLKQLREVSE